MPVFTKAGCNVGVCHAKAGGGQRGFQLSLLGFEPLEDFEHVVNEGRGRRLFLGAPDRSPNLALRDGKWKLLINADATGAELYDLADDPNESQNLAATPIHIERLASLRAKLDTYVKSQGYRKIEPRATPKIESQ